MWNNEIDLIEKVNLAHKLTALGKLNNMNGKDLLKIKKNNEYSNITDIYHIFLK